VKVKFNKEKRLEKLIAQGFQSEGTELLRSQIVLEQLQSIYTVIIQEFQIVSYYIHLQLILNSIIK
jgi:hypothetical protein